MSSSPACTASFDLSEAEQTARVLRALEKPPMCASWLTPPDASCSGATLTKIDLAQVFTTAARLGVAVEHNAAPARTDLSDAHMRLAKSLGCPISINTDAHTTSELDHMQHGIIQLRRAWLTPADVVNTAPDATAFLSCLRSRP